MLRGSHYADGWQAGVNTAGRGLVLTNVYFSEEPSTVRCSWEVKSILGRGKGTNNVCIPGRMSILKAHKEGRRGPDHKGVEICSEGKRLPLNGFRKERG